jgi:glycosyltransferase involved in cell wall biosynthesis
MNILFITHQPQDHHGWARYTRELSQSVQKLGHQTTIYDPQLSIDRPWINPAKFLLQTNKIHQLSSNFDLVHIVPEPYALFIPFLTRSHLKSRHSEPDEVGSKNPPQTHNLDLKTTSKPTLLTTHGSFAINQLLRPFPLNHLYLHCYCQASRIVSVSRFTKNQITSHAPHLSIAIIPNGINTQKFSPPHPSLRQPLILSVGAVKHRKGYHISIPAAIPFLKTHPRFRYLIIGPLSDPSYHQQLISLIKNHHLSNQVQFLGSVPDRQLISLYQKARLFLLTPVSLKSKRHHKFEGFGQVFLEAQACGCPVVTSRSGGAPETIVNHQTGLLTPEANIPKTTQAIESLLTHPQKLNHMSKTTRIHATKFSWETIAKKYLDLYHQALRS